MSSYHTITDAGYVDLYALAGAALSTEISLQVKRGTLYLDDVASQPAVTKEAFTRGQGSWTTINAAGAWVRAVGEDCSFVVG